MFNLFRIEEDKKVAGVCAGLAKSFEVDPTIVRILFVFSMFVLNGFGFWLYLALILVMPVLPEGQDPIKFDSAVFEGKDFRKYAGFGFGIYSIINNLNIYWLSWVNYENLWPLILVLGGFLMLKNIVKDDESTDEFPENNKDDKYE
mgnify:CR=1 FL=1